MTCIAYRDRLIAVDRQVTHNGVISQTDDKIFINNDTTVITFAGPVVVGYVFKKWYFNGCKKEEWPFSTEIPDRCNFVALVMKTDTNTLEYWDDILSPMSLDTKIYHAYGSGREIALGAMFEGATPQNAVKAANKHLDDCGFGVCYVDGVNKELIIKKEESI